jgi:hypothetical protein
MGSLDFTGDKSPESAFNLIYFVGSLLGRIFLGRFGISTGSSLY